MTQWIRIEGARQNNLKNLSLALRTRALTVVTGVSGSGKSSLVFDTLYAEGQRRYVETFSPYARQFLERMDKPQVDSIDGVPPAIAINQGNPVRTSRSTVGTLTELADHFKLLYARAAELVCRGCGETVRHDTVASIAARLRADVAADARCVITFPLPVPAAMSEAELATALSQQGYVRLQRREAGAAAEGGDIAHVVQDRFRLAHCDDVRLAEAIEAALARGKGRMAAVFGAEGDAGDGVELRFSSALHCAPCDIDYAPSTPALFSFNSPLGACEHCHGFGRIIGVDHDLVVPDPRLTLREGAIKPWQSKSFRESQDDLEKFAAQAGVPLDVPFAELDPQARAWVLEGDPGWVSWAQSWPAKWYGVRHFFGWLESKAYKMHIRVLLSRYRSYTECPHCRGSRLKPEAGLWRLDGVAIHALLGWPVKRVRDFVAAYRSPALVEVAGQHLQREILARLDYLVAVGLPYLTLDRASRTLSGGELQRIHLTTALGTALVNTLFVLDEPSIGLHPRDVERIVGVMARLRDAGNTLVVVEHDPQIMRAADDLLEIGPGPGARGGEIVARGSIAELCAQPASLTGAYLSGARSVARSHAAVAIDATTPHLAVRDAHCHNLHGLDVDLPLRGLVVLAGVSGSGKSTLLHDVLYPALARHFGEAGVAAPGRVTLHGLDVLDGVCLVDQNPIGKSARSTPVSHVGAWNAIRTRFAALPQAREAGITAGSFSFNSGTGRCPLCQGSGFEHVEMQFLADVYLRCPECDGKRYRPEILALHDRGHSIADVLELTVDEALAFYADDAAIAAALAPLVAVGLGYMRLGQPVPTLSGGEAQRLKLAAHLAAALPAGKSRRRKNERLLFLLDEPTTGLHFEDIVVLLRAFDSLLDAGHALLVIEHNLDVLRAADWIVELGPEGGEEGGLLVASGTPAHVQTVMASPTGAALAAYAAASVLPPKGATTATQVAEAPARYVTLPETIEVRHAREHNLKNISVSLPRDRLTVISGLSGSGKSTLAFDILFGEGQRRYLESLNAYARQFVQSGARADVEQVSGLPPTVAIEQRTSRGGQKSTVGTLTEIQPFLRLLYAKLGVQTCPDCGDVVAPQSFDSIVAQVRREHAGRTVELRAPLVVARKGLYTALAKWARDRGHATLIVDGETLATRGWPRLDRYREHTIDLPLGRFALPAADAVWPAAAEEALRVALAEALQHGKEVVKVALPEVADCVPQVLSTKRACPSCGTSFPEPDIKLLSHSARQGWCPACYGTGVRLTGKVDDPHAVDFETEHDAHGETLACPECAGTRLNPVARAVRFHEHGIAELTAAPVHRLQAFFADLRLDGREAGIGGDLINEIRGRLDFLASVGLDYLALDRAAPTLSGGEAQRIRLAAQLGSSLQGVCYVLDEPSIGLHPRDNQRLLAMLAELRARGNTLVVVEHDLDTIRAADHVIELGPGAGVRGGEVVASGTLAVLLAEPRSVTGQCLRQPLVHPLQARRPVDGKQAWLRVRGANLHNLKNLAVGVPLGRLTAITGVSGSGKSTFARDVLFANLRARLADPQARLRGCTALEGWEAVGRVLEVDQTPIGKTPRSCPATYIGFWDAIRKLFADSFEARARGWTASRFSFNTGAGRCPVCEGQGRITVEMNFLPDVKVPCEACGGGRFNEETLAVRWRGRTVAEVLAMEVDEAVEFFAAHPAIAHPLHLLQDVGLGYLTLGQASPTLSGGEAQRIKLVTELARVRPGAPRRRNEQPALYVLDEPTVGLHQADVVRLIRVLHRLVDAGQTVVVIEHDFDVVAEADWMIDFGPEGGENGGEVVMSGVPASGTPALRSSTDAMLREFLRTAAPDSP